MYGTETVKHAVGMLQERVSFYRDAIARGEDVHAVISTGNKKIGDTLNVSMAPIITCANCAGCMHYCYDVKAVMMYKNVLNARAKNTALYMEKPGAYFQDIINAIIRRKNNKFFRWHVSGDIPDMDYLSWMIYIARMFPEWTFWTYTKNYRVVNELVRQYGKESIPRNLSIMFSEWKGMAMNNPHGFPEFRVVMKADKKPEGVRWCCGNCNECIRNRSHCVKGETVYCMEH